MQRQRLLFTGFNAFGQTNKGNDCAAADNIVFSDVDRPQSEDNCLISLSWRYTAYAVEEKIWLRGLLDKDPNECLEVEAPDRIQALAASDSHCLILLQNGDLYKLQPHLKATLQRIQLEKTTLKTNTPVKRSVFGLPKESSTVITHIACGTQINVAISSSNAVYSIPSCLYQFPERQWRVQQLICGHEHALLLNGNGDIYSWGNGLRGQLGQSVLGVEETPLLLDALAGIKITFIAAGGWHSAAISAFGDLYAWGHNSHGQLGMRVMKPGGLLKEPTVYPLPQLIELPSTECCCQSESNEDSCAPLRVFAGSRHTLLLRSCGKLWGTGWSYHGQLGKQQQNVQFLDAFQSLNDTRLNLDCDIRCGPWATMVLSPI
ncbi:LOW QUALITY PROTEIN: RCC1 domain-containing protein 1 [Drosophila tropicalis]|uniref:LOW QUALITY PROTEIN: RCC1 domain-containing protein 1 n=1 Tax=Drosophila tropicalis TaxID=46794 RepID=UPI0035AB990F